MLVCMLLVKEREKEEVDSIMRAVVFLWFSPRDSWRSIVEEV
jgi:hypothetical protein